MSLNGNDEKSYVGRVTTLAGLISDGLFVDGDWVETKDQDPNGEVRLIQLADIGDGTFRDRSSRYLTLAKARELRCTFLEPGDILIARMPQPLGRACLFPGVGQPAVTAVDVCIVRPNSRRVHPGWLVGMINAPQFRLAMTQFVRGTTRQRISRTNLGRLTMPVPELNEQAAIARQLEKIKARDVSIAERLAAARGIVDRIRGAVLAAACSGRLTAGWRADHPDELVGDIARALERRRVEARKFVQATLNFHATFDDLPESWRVVPLGLVVTDLQYGTSKRSAYDTRGTAVLRIPNVSSGVVTTDDLKFADLDNREAMRLCLRSGDLLMIRSNGSVGLVGLTTEVPPSAEGMAFAGYLIRLRVDPDFVIPGFLRLALASPTLRQQIEIPARSTSGVHNINSREVRSLGVPLPPLCEQQEIVDRAIAAVQTAGRLADAISAAEANLEGAVRHALAKAFRGEMLPAEPAIAAA